MSIGIVILNYLNWEDTIECVDSLYKQSYQDFEVVIVDNRSNNQSIEKMKASFKNKNRIHILETEKNEGFAKGNNVGISFCKNKLKLKNVLAINNDVVFTDQDYLKKLVSYNIGQDVGAVGTKIIGSDGKNQNPVYLGISFYRILKHLLEPYLREKGFNSLLNIIRKIVQRIKKVFKKQSKSSNNSNVTSSSVIRSNKEFLLHGSAIYFTENFLKLSNGWYPDTFLYYEENILGIIFEKTGLKMHYIDDFEIYHKEDKSSDLSFGNKTEVKRKWLRKSIIEGLKVKITPRKSLLKKLSKSNYPYRIIN